MSIHVGKAILDFLSVKYGKENFYNSNNVSEIDRQNNLNANTKQIVEQNLPTNFQSMITGDILFLTLDRIKEELPQESQNNFEELLTKFVREIVILIHDKQSHREVTIDDIFFLTYKSFSEEVLKPNNNILVRNYVRQYLTELNVDKPSDELVTDITNDAFEKIPQHIRNKITNETIEQYKYSINTMINSSIENNLNNLNNLINSNKVTILQPEVELAPYVEIFPQIFKHQGKNIYYYYDKDSGILSNMEYPTTQPDMVIGDVIDLLEKHKISEGQINKVEDLITEELREIGSSKVCKKKPIEEEKEEEKIEEVKESVEALLQKALNKKYEICPEEKSKWDLLLASFLRYRIILGMIALIIVILIVLLAQVSNIKK